MLGRGFGAAAVAAASFSAGGTCAGLVCSEPADAGLATGSAAVFSPTDLSAASACFKSPQFFKTLSDLLAAPRGFPAPELAVRFSAKEVRLARGTGRSLRRVKAGAANRLPWPETVALVSTSGDGRAMKYGHAWSGSTPAQIGAVEPEWFDEVDACAVSVAVAQIT